MSDTPRSPHFNEKRSQAIHRVFDDYRQWVQDTLTTEPQPWIQVLASCCSAAADVRAASAQDL